MVTLPSTSNTPRFTFVGIECHFTRRVLENVLACGITVGGMILPGPPGDRQPVPVRSPQRSLPLHQPSFREPGLDDLLRSHGIPAYRVSNLRSQNAVQLIRSFETEILVCACFPQRIPRTITHLFPGRALNVHPSLLPDKRGPDPLFWTFREGSGRSGVTIHELAPRFDAGPILSQGPFSYSDGATEMNLEASLASLAAEMVRELLPSLVESHPRWAQDESDATYAPWPEPADFHLDPNMTARAAFNFVRGIEGRGYRFTVDHQGASREVVEVMDYATSRSEIDSQSTELKFADGYLIARLRPLAG